MLPYQKIIFSELEGDWSCEEMRNKGVEAFMGDWEGRDV